MAPKGRCVWGGGGGSGGWGGGQKCKNRWVWGRCQTRVWREMDVGWDRWGEVEAKNVKRWVWWGRSVCSTRAWKEMDVGQVCGWQKCEYRWVWGRWVCVCAWNKGVKRNDGWQKKKKKQLCKLVCQAKGKLSWKKERKEKKLSLHYLTYLNRKFGLQFLTADIKH